MISKTRGSGDHRSTVYRPTGGRTATVKSACVAGSENSKSLRSDAIWRPGRAEKLLAGVLVSSPAQRHLEGDRRRAAAGAKTPG